MIEWVVRAALKSKLSAETWVATDSADIARAAEQAGAGAVMTSDQCQSGTDRIAEAAATVKADVYANVQGDEPLVDPADIDALIDIVGKNPDAEMATLTRPFESAEEFNDPNVVKVVCAANGDALYFSRSPIPYFRSQQDLASALAGGNTSNGSFAPVLAHIGMYAFRRDALLAFSKLPSGLLEQAEKLEQLRALEAGWKIKALKVESKAVGVDAPSDLKAVENALRRRFL